ncbi:MAG: hypothetical protein JSV12_06105 [Candidatus Bathyarchaeota archaeon]|nr:MAG: hypothetical protein JSV12_06105 [Candidatus Bathyarchaeota archaeon]
MPFGKWASFEDCVQNIKKTQNYDEETAKKVCGKLQTQLGKESFSWVGDIKPSGKLIRGKALHPLKTVHPEEWPSVRVYLEKELHKSAHTLAGKPLLIDHTCTLRGKVLDAKYENGAIEYIAKLDDQNTLNKIRNRKIRHCSVEFEWKTLENVNGVAPRGINFTALSLLENFLPGDPLSSVEVWETIVKRLKETKNVRRDVHKKEQTENQEFILHQIHDPAAFLEERFSTAWIDQTNGIQGIFGRLREDPENPQLMALLFMKTNDWTIEKVQKWLHDHPQYVRQIQPQPSPAAVGVQPTQTAAPPSQIQTGVMEMNKQALKERIWTRQYTNDLPDSAFALILPKGSTNESDRTTSRNLRKIPHHRADESIDLLHLRNALARVPQSDLSQEQKKRALAHLKKHAKAAGIGEFAEESLKEQDGKALSEEIPGPEFKVAPEPTLEEVVESVENILGEIRDAINKNFSDLDARLKALEKPEEPETVATEQQGETHECPEGQHGDQEQEKRVPNKKALGEAIIAPSAFSQLEPSDLINKKEVLELLPEEWIVRAWSYGPQLLVRQLRHKLESQSSGNSDRE